MSSDMPSEAVGIVHNRRGGLIFFGMVEILIGLVCAALVPLTVLGIVMNARSMGRPLTWIELRSAVPGALAYGLLALFFVWVGIGSILARRWARALMLVMSWLWLLLGAIVMGFMVFFLRKTFVEAAQAGTMPPQAQVVMTVVVAVLGFIYIFLPALFVLFYKSRHVRATCERTDVRTRWTDRCPLPVLAVSLVLVFSGINVATSAVYGVLPCGGRLLTGAPAMAGLAAVALVCLVLAVPVYRLKCAGWWGTVALVVASAASTAVTFLRVDLLELYEKMGIATEGAQQEALKQVGMLDGRTIAVWTAVSAAATIVYLLGVHRFFRRKPA